jgi:hypothetical protein
LDTIALGNIINRKRQKRQKKKKKDSSGGVTAGSPTLSPSLIGGTGEEVLFG